MSGKNTILVVDDDPDFQFVTERILSSAGYEVVCALTKAEGLAAVRQNPPDLIILDMMMERPTDGFFFLYEMRDQHREKCPPVLAVSVISEKTGVDFSPTGEDGYLPADAFLDKPVVPDELLGKVKELLSGEDVRK